ncbi:unnamed protein product [Eruca vesicaria subsp. sativa]|uniref:F-box domain-containing protein n=1 Tax=Eruca vesicaria subsp. sativa TaxID=29727 RepID=A0ABC8KPZ8_ERUVS|nr:unnamed protein product [Eruca vesicaria subsp. sativa]
MSPSSFSSLPNDIVSDILARVPKRFHPTLSCVSKTFRRLLLSPELHKIRSLLRKDSLFISFANKPNDAAWFTLRRAENNPTENRFVSIDLVFPSQREKDPSIVSIGSELFFICGSFYPSSTMYVLDSRTGKFRKGPSSRADKLYRSVGVVGSKVYVVGSYRDDEIHVEAFDVRTQTWELAPFPEDQRSWWGLAATVSLNRKVCTLRYFDNVAKCYDTRDGSCESFGLPKGDWLGRTGACVMNNVLYVYYARFGLMWFDSELEMWRVVDGLTRLKKVWSVVAMAEYYGKMALLWEDKVGGERKDVWCRMVSLERSEEGVQGIAEASQLLGSVPRGYRLQHCLSVSD